jgi:heptosyltransferase-1
MGDIIHTWPLAEALRVAQPDMHLGWAVESPFIPIVEGHPAIDAVIPVATGRWRRRPFAATTRTEVAQLKGRFRELQPEIAIDSQGVLKSALLTRLTGAPARVGLARPWRRERLAGPAYTSTVPGCRSHRHVVATNLELARAAGGTPPSSPPAPDGSWLLQRLSHRPPPLPLEQPYAVLLPGAGHPRKVLPATDLGRVSDAIVDAGLEVVVAWGPGEERRAVAVESEAASGTRVAPATDLLELTLLLGGARLVVGGDTGPVHLAASLGVPTLGIYKVTDWRRNGPLGRSVEVVSGVDETDDAPTGSAWARPTRPVTAREVVEGVHRLLERVST